MRLTAWLFENGCSEKKNAITEDPGVAFGNDLHNNHVVSLIVNFCQ
jgi:hypothetical protein